MFTPTVGSTVRVAVDTKTKRRGVVATIQHDRTACVLLDDEAPPVGLVVPRVERTRTTQEERTVPLENIHDLLSFERIYNHDDDDLNGSFCNDPVLVVVQTWKDRGDQLLKLGDHTSAAKWYEKSLQASNQQVQMGGTVIFKVKGHAKLADVDCIENDCLDVTVRENEQEATIHTSSVLLSVLKEDPDRLQERILLNLARCLLRLAEITGSADRRLRYLKSAVLSCTLALELVAHSDGSHKMCLLLRSQAQLLLSKYSHAASDINLLLRLDPEHKQGQALLRKIERQRIQSKLADKRLVKEMCKWVDAATSHRTVSSEDNEPNVMETMLPRTTNTDSSQLLTPRNMFSPGMAIILAIVAAYVVKSLSNE
jgi:tetratricopeptide (TPR) repeat protein